MFEKPTPTNCEICQKPLESNRCPDCNGKGHHIGDNKVKIKCVSCEGTGLVLSCPDLQKHLLDTLGGNPIQGEKSTDVKIERSDASSYAQKNSGFQKYVKPFASRFFQSNSKHVRSNRLPGDPGTDAPPPERKPKIK